jgi:hypothetical protein
MRAEEITDQLLGWPAFDGWLSTDPSGRKLLVTPPKCVSGVRVEVFTHGLEHAFKPTVRRLPR